jgi:hypothetical protein
VLALSLCAGPALAQQNAIGLGVGQSQATADPSATPNSRAASAYNGLTINTGQPATTRSDVNTIIEQRGGTFQRQSGTTNVRNVPAVFAPGLASASLETCLGSVSAGGSGLGFGFTAAATMVDKGCDARLDARQLWAMGLRKASLARLCLKPEIAQSLPECVDYLPQQAPQAGYVAAAPVQAARLEPSPYAGGAVEVIEKRTGATRLCAQYDPNRGRCLRWGR